MTTQHLHLPDGRTVDLAELERVARAATPGKREFFGEQATFAIRAVGQEWERIVGGDLHHDGERPMMGGVWEPGDAAHIAAFDRETCLALLARLRELEEGLRPFAEWYAKYGEDNIAVEAVDGFRRAAALLRGSNTTPAKE